MEQKLYNFEETLTDIMQNYVQVEGVADELRDEYGNIRPAWTGFVDFFSRLSEDDIEKRFARGDQYLQDAGVFYRQYDDDGYSERDWPLSHIPVILDDLEWQSISTGLKQRADLLEAVMADLYGPMTLVSDGHLPADLIAKSPEWLRPMVGTTPRSGHFLNLLAFEIGRGPDGQWWVLGDRTQSPSGSGFALENRVATAHVFADYYKNANVHRLAGFFKSFRDSLVEMSDEQDCGIGILTPGRLIDTYFEHAYIARYLGFMLLEGEDLLVRNGKPMVRTVDGLKPISVLWRRLDASYTDPLELNEASILGTPGLANAARQGSVSMVNSLGSGVLENRVMLAFLPRISQALTGEQLLLPNIATWWCGQDQERDQVLANVEGMMFGPALSTNLPFEKNEMASLLDNVEGEALRNKIYMNGDQFVGQEAIKLSTTPVYEEGRLVPRPMTIRVFLARSQNGWEVMPGGYARIGENKGKTVLALQGGGQVADVWISSNDKIIDKVSLQEVKKPFVRKGYEVLPSRAAENLFWLGRYTERAELMLRMARAYHIRLDEIDDPEAQLLTFFAKFMEPYAIKPEEAVSESICHTLMSAVGSAGHLRDRFSNDGWLALKDLSETAWDFTKVVAPGDDAARALQVLLRKISGFSGLVHESMYHYTGWRFMKMGRAMERASTMASVLQYFTQDKAPSGALDIPVDIGDSVMTHRRRYVVTTNRETVVDLLALDEFNPRSILYQITEFNEHLKYLPGEQNQLQVSDLSKMVLKIQTDLTLKAPEALNQNFFIELENSINEICNALSMAYLK